MKSNYEHFVLTASCLKADIWSAALHHVQGRSALIFWTVTHPDAVMPAVPTHIQLATVPARGFWSYFCSWAMGAWDKISVREPNCMFLKSRTSFLPQPVGPGGSSPGPLQAVPVQKSSLAASRAVHGSPGSPRSGVHPAGESHRRLRLEVQAQTAPTEPSARIQSTTGGIRGFRQLIAEFTFIQSVCVRGRERRINLTAGDFSNYLRGGCKMTV